MILPRPKNRVSRGRAGVVSAGRAFSKRIVKHGHGTWKRAHARSEIGREVFFASGRIWKEDEKRRRDVYLVRFVKGIIVKRLPKFRPYFKRFAR